MSVGMGFKRAQVCLYRAVAGIRNFQPTYPNVRTGPLVVESGVGFVPAARALISDYLAPGVSSRSAEVLPFTPR